MMATVSPSARLIRPCRGVERRGGGGLLARIRYYRIEPTPDLISRQGLTHGCRHTVPVNVYAAVMVTSSSLPLCTKHASLRVSGCRPSDRGDGNDSTAVACASVGNRCVRPAPPSGGHHAGTSSGPLLTRREMRVGTHGLVRGPPTRRRHCSRVNVSRGWARSGPRADPDRVHFLGV